MPSKSASWSMKHARDRFGAMVKAARSGPQTITKRGKPAVVVVAPEEYERLRQLEHRTAPTLAEHLLSMPRDDGEFERLQLDCVEQSPAPRRTS